jgi:hypothetical protein
MDLDCGASTPLTVSICAGHSAYRWAYSGRVAGCPYVQLVQILSLPLAK